ncbi:MAG: hydroxyethylthiazole kinase [Polyangia bacterium]|jgi:hydroxyethylthiazole kinase
MTTHVRLDQVGAELSRMRQAAPLVHVLTNEVVQEFTANVLLAIGAAPAMIVAEEEAAAFASIASAVLVNIGTLYPARYAAMVCAVDAAVAAGTPWVLDPVAVGVLRYRTEAAEQLLTKHPAVIRGNASEILALAGLSQGGRGVDSTASSQSAVQAAESLAKQTGAIVAVTGAVDYVTDGAETIAIPFGHPLMTKVVGTGCALSAVTAAFVAGVQDRSARLSAVAAACAVMALCGEQAVKQSHGPGSFKPSFLDALAVIDPVRLRGP